MVQKDFLGSLKESLEKGEFNSEAANKINEIVDKSKKFEENAKPGDLGDAVKKRVEESGVKESVSEEELPELNTEYEQKMAHFKKADKINLEIATLKNIEDVVLNQLTELSNFIDILRKKYEKDNPEEFPELKQLLKNIESLEKKYNFVINVNKNN